MPTILTHPAVPLALGIGLGPHIVPARLLLAGVAASVLPDLDVVTVQLGVASSGALGHRGASHSLLFAALVGLAGAGAHRALRSGFLRAWWFLFVATASHGALDACTNGGWGIAFLWPWSGERYFAPFRVIEVSPLSLRRFMSERGLVVLGSELVWVWIPCVVMAAVSLGVRRRRPWPGNRRW